MLCLICAPLLLTCGCSHSSRARIAEPNSSEIANYSFLTGAVQLDPLTDETDYPSFQPTGSWWEGFQRNELSMLISIGLQSSPGLDEFNHRIEQASALLRRESGARLPQLELGGQSLKSFQSGNQNSNSYRLAGDARWDTDLFGRRRFLEESQYYRLNARNEDLNRAKLELSTFIAGAYLDLVLADLLHHLLLRQLSNAEDYMDIIKARERQGVVSNLDVLQQASQIAQIRSQFPQIALDRRRSALRLSLLTGLPQHKLNTFVKTRTFPPLPLEPALDMSVDLLDMRPDLRLLRSELMAADADADSFMAARFPSLGLSLSTLMIDGSSGSTTLLNLAANAFLPIFDGGQRSAQYNFAIALRDERRARLTYEYIRAITEVDEVVVAEHKQRELLDLLISRKDIAEATLTQAQDRYSFGLTDFLPVLTARDSLNTIEQRLLREVRALLQLRITLHRTIGGPVIQGADAEHNTVNS
jgi:NodT family efflux transporter outer membrane factor (OMF) lipoprotein